MNIDSSMITTIIITLRQFPLAVFFWSVKNRLVTNYLNHLCFRTHRNAFTIVREKIMSSGRLKIRHKQNQADADLFTKLPCSVSKVKQDKTVASSSFQFGNREIFSMAFFLCEIKFSSFLICFNCPSMLILPLIVAESH